MLCGLCPRNCRADRETKPGVCGMPWEPVVARAMLHQWEEPCLVGEKGAGAVFFSGCNLRCVYCQNKPISQGGVGKAVSVSRLREKRKLRQGPLQKPQKLPSPFPVIKKVPKDHAPQENHAEQKPISHGPERKTLQPEHQQKDPGTGKEQNSPLPAVPYITNDHC